MCSPEKRSCRWARSASSCESQPGRPIAVTYWGASRPIIERNGGFLDTTSASADLRHRHEDKILLILTLIIGATVGLVVVAFILLTENLGARLYPAGAAAWRRILIPVAGALGTGFIPVSIERLRHMMERTSIRSRRPNPESVAPGQLHGQSG